MAEKRLYVYYDRCNDYEDIFLLTKEEARAINWFINHYCCPDEQSLRELDNSKAQEVV